ncbi:Cytochrome C [Tenacibaculum sp. 190130A14a]|uniref:Cytochrome C n=1 Tax=Tenacibaculum polynesiense TaxID=3137857 RepID=A0ABP1EZ38_9FLAO
MKIFKKLILILLAIIVVAQFFQPEKNEGEYTSLSAFLTETKPSEDVQEILKVACFDCHSNTTRYPWYSNITPINFWMADHVRHGKGDLNFSNWDSYSLKKKEHKMEEVWEEVEEKHMPIDSYKWTHGDARLTDAQIQLVVTWGKQVQENYKSKLN